MKDREIPILMYHQFLENKNLNTKIKTFVTAKQFELQLKILKILGYQTITFKDLKKIGLKNRFNKKYIILTIDDGYKNNYDIMLPILKKYRMKAVIFLVSDVEYNKWDVEKYKEEKLFMMNKKEIKEMIESNLIEFGGHTLNHCDFAKVSLKEARREIFYNKEKLEKEYNINLISFAYPYGHLTPEVKRLVKEAGYEYAVSTDTGTGYIEDDLFEIRRTGIDRTSFIDFLRKISSKYSIYKGKKWLKTRNENTKINEKEKVK